MSTAFSAAKFGTQPFPLNPISTISHEIPLVFSKHTCQFLGLTWSSKFNLSRRSGTVVSVSDEKKSKCAPILVITKEEGLELYEDMVLGRTFENMCHQMFSLGKICGFVHLYNGQEAVSTGFIKLLKQQDSVVSTYRDHVHALSKGVPARDIMSELFGKITGCCRGRGGSMHMFSRDHNLLGGFAYIGEGIPVATRAVPGQGKTGLVATGAAFTSKYKREVLKEADCDHVALAFFGDGACNNGHFFECLNMAALWKLPIVFVVVDGMDVLKVREVAKEAIGRARLSQGPTLVECETYRFRGHSVADSDQLRDPNEKEHYAARDPIKALKKYLIETSLVSEQELEVVDNKIDQVVEDAVEFADQSHVPAQTQLFENLFADPKGFGIGPHGI
ncbi:hypothetical protein V6N13_080761 [Hibiscus sabdariffa]|uniref:Uncharacterized protein n=2 Tax=Hibiscus sabdariffa TaxID=183260 RepID=A0ABR2NS45_9ROSI